MKAEAKGSLFELKENDKRVPNSPLFKSFMGAIGWPDETGHDHFALSWALVAGITEDNSMVLIHEQSASPAAFADVLIALKDNFLLPRYYVNLELTNIKRMKALRQTPELTYYPGRKILTGDWKFYPATAPSFRNYENTAAIVERAIDPEVGLYELKRRAAKNEIAIRPNCARVTWLARQPAPFKAVLTHPLLFAISCLLEEHKPNDLLKSKVRGWKTPYPNL